MILNVIREGENTSNNTKLNLELNNQNEDKVELKRIKELLNVNDLRYVSSNVRQLLGIVKENDPTCFSKTEGNIRKVITAGEKFRVILYIRLSREDGDLENGDVSGSIKNQLQFLLDECDKKGWIVVGIFCEEDESGVDDKRPEWIKSLRFAELGNAEIYLCKSQSRFTRSMEMVEKYLHKCFPEWNVRFLGLVDNTDTNIEENKKSRQINGLVNEWFVEDTSKSTREILNNKKKNGQFVGKTAPYGYLRDPNDKHHLIPDPIASEAIKLMADMLLQGKSHKEVCQQLMRKGFLTPADHKVSMGIGINRGKNKIKYIQYQVEINDTLKDIAHKFFVTVEEIKQLNNKNDDNLVENEVIIIPHKQKWNNRMLRDILTDETQIGSLVQGKSERISYKDKRQIEKPKSEWIIVPHCHEANLDLETFNKLGKMFSIRHRIQKDGTVQLFSKKLYCSCCGKTFNKTSAKSKEYLRCKGNNSTDGYICDNKSVIEMSVLKEYVLDKIKEKINNYYDVSKVEKDYYEQNVYDNIDNQISKIESDIQHIKNELEQKESLKYSLYNDKTNGLLTLEDFEFIFNKNNVEIEKLKDRMNNLLDEIKLYETSKINKKEKEKLFDKYKNINDLNKIVLDTFVKKINIGKVDDLTGERPICIEWNLTIL